ncbi:sensor histidine kinase [Variovorax sp. UMC13]|uniref:sensor histidine kinase n=1 Tax=Variovorax sp. UMC13 TaxID=1862326 RepID=UPI00217FEB71|nr:histidine kinase [Variovorax sp. UMC13]MBB1598550.1 histidine kinase [Variovorax sp. UMC13]
MSLAAPSATPPSRRLAEDLRDMLRHGLVTAVFCCLIAIALTVTKGGGWANHLVYSLSIGTISWLFIDGCRLLLTRGREIRWPLGVRGYLVVVVGVTLGFLGGNLIGDAWIGAPTFDFLDFAGHKLATAIVITITATVGMCFYFYSLGRSKHLLGQIEQARRDATEARLKLLEAQLEPHMLFNTLANLRVLITLDPPRAVTMLDRLNSYLRVTLSGSRALSHPLGAEFDRLGDYLELMAVRMGPRLRYTLDLPAALREVPVPPLLLQPLVENAIRHGLEPQVEGGEITVRARREGARLVLEVCDTGQGQASGGAPSEGGGFGLTQVRERLATLHGDDGVLQLHPLREGGTCASISFPLTP